jgi:hypothetical protein
MGPVAAARRVPSDVVASPACGSGGDATNTSAQPRTPMDRARLWYRTLEDMMRDQMRVRMKMGATDSIIASETAIGAESD